MSTKQIDRNGEETETDKYTSEKRQKETDRYGERDSEIQVDKTVGDL